MGCIRPATPGFLVTLVATALLAVVSFCVPYFKSVFFLKANISISGVNGSITFGTLGYCLELQNGTTCSSPSVGYQLDINSLVGNKLPVEIPQVVVKWITYALVLHIVALALSAGSAVFGLLAHVREMSMTYCSTCVSGFAAAVAMLAFVFDIILFFLAKARINAIGTAEIGNAIWLTLAAWILLFFSGCFYTLGRCCISKRKPRGDWDKRNGTEHSHSGGVDQMRLDAIKAEADRKAKQKDLEVGLPAFHEVQPLAARIDGNNVYLDTPDDDNTNANYGGRPGLGGGYSGGGYMQAPAGSRAVDEYYSPTRTEHPSTYPPPPQQPHPQGAGYAAGGYPQNIAKPVSPPQHPQRQGSYAQSQYGTSQYTPSQYAPSTYANPVSHSAPSPPVNQYLAAVPPHGTDRYGTPQNYGHNSGGTSYHTATPHEQQPTGYSQYDPYEHRVEASHNDYNNNNLASNPPMPTPGYQPDPTSYFPPQQGQYQPQRSYTLGGAGYNSDGYNTNPAPPPHDASNLHQDQHVPAQINTNTGYVPPAQTSPVKGPRAHTQLSVRNDLDDSPPVYDAGTSNVQGAWGKR